MVLPQQATWLDQNLTVDELSISIDELKVKKSPEKDGLPAKFFKISKGTIIGPLWEFGKKL